MSGLLALLVTALMVVLYETNDYDAATVDRFHPHRPTLRSVRARPRGSLTAA